MKREYENKWGYMSEISYENVLDISSEDLFPDSTLNFPLYFFVAGQYVLFKPEGTLIKPADLKRLKDNGIDTVFIQKKHELEFTIYLDSNVSKIVSSPSVSKEEKSRHLIKNADYVIKNIFDDPENPQSFMKSRALVKNFVDFMAQGGLPFNSLISLSSHDIYTYIHSIGVMTYSLALASQFGINANQTLNDIGLAGLFHDIGKTRIPEKIINKPGPLDDEEWSVMKKHSSFSYEIANRYKSLPELALMAIRQHHENSMGTGYPDGIQGPDLFFFSKLITACDIYSAITTDRSYSKKRNCFEALQLMKTFVEKGTLNKNIFMNLVLMLKG